MKSFIPYGQQWIDEDDIEEVKKILKTDWLTQGPKVEEFEKAMSQYCSAQYAVAVSSGTTGLHLACKAAGIGPGDEVVTTTMTFVATSNALVYLGAKPVFVDIESNSLNINPDLIEKAITSKTKAIIIVDFAGHPCDFNRIKEIAEKHNLLIIEDAAHALGSEYNGKKIGSLADLTIFSFHPVKNITTGEGGMVLTNNKELYQKLKTLRHHGIVKKPEKGEWYYEINDLGFNFRLTDFQSALGLSQLKKLDRFIKRRKEIRDKYNQAFKHVKEIITIRENHYAKSAWHIYVVQVNERDRLFRILRENGIGVQVHYIPVHLLFFYKKKFGYKQGDFPVAESYYQKAITLPLFPKMTNHNIERVINLVKNEIPKK